MALSSPFSRSLSNAIGALTALTYLGLSNNMLDDLPGGMAALSGLQVSLVSPDITLWMRRC